jgi:Flp pilus assembly pilin Flp
MKLMRQLWNDESGFVVSAELILIATIAVLGLLVGLASVRDGVTSELSDVAGAFQDANQSYSVDGVIGHNANSAGFDFADDLDECDDEDQIEGVADNCITFAGPGGNTGEISEETPFTALRNGPFP